MVEKRKEWKKIEYFGLDLLRYRSLKSGRCKQIPINKFPFFSHNECFQTRATSLQDFIFKDGQAGITKATVTLVFDNSEPAQCPIGYEKCKKISVTRQIVVGVKNKYMINGKNVQNKAVVDLFCSVQLNVNNPNFMIMRGRITKVLNTKPQEVNAEHCLVYFCF